MARFGLLKQLLLSLAVVGVSVLSVTPPVMAAPGRAVPQQMSSRPMLKGTVNTGYPVYYYNWSGYAATDSAPFTAVETTYVQPTVTCPVAGAWTLFWVGLDGYQNNSVEQAGTAAQCGGGSNPQPTYYAWWEMYPSNGITAMPLTIKPGDTVQASVTYSNGSYVMGVRDKTTKQAFSQTSACPSYYTCARQSAEWIVERPYSGSSYTSLANWSTMTFTVNKAADQTKRNGVPAWRSLTSFANNPITMVNDPYTGENLAAPGTLASSGKFSDIWLATQ